MSRVLRAHPLTESYALPIPPLVLAVAAGVVVLVVALAPPARRRPAPAPTATDVWQPGDDRLTRAQVVGRSLGVALLLIAVLAGRVGTDDQLDNLAPALVVGIAWPLLFLAAAVLGPVWRYVDPWDSLARVMTPGSDPEPTVGRPPVWPAVVMVLPWLWFLGVHQDTLAPRSVGLVLALYSLVTVAGCLALGRRRWLRTAEPLGILLGWLGWLPRGRLVGWQPAPGAEVLLGTVLGGLLFGVLRHSELWGNLNTIERADLAATAGLLGCSLVGVLVVVACRALTLPGGDPAAVARAVVPLLAAVVVAVGLERNRLTTSLQLLPGLLGDPLGRGWDLLGTANQGLDPAPFGVAGLMWLQAGVILLGALAAVVATTRWSAGRAARLPAALAVAVVADAAVLLLTVH